MQHQDWEQVIFHKKSSTPSKEYVAISTKTFAQKQDQMLMNNDDTSKLKLVGKDLANAIIVGRCAKKWNQSDLARNVNMSVQIIKSIEAGTEVYNPNQINSIARKLGINLKDLR